MHASIDLVLEAHRSKLKQGAVLLDPNDDSTTPKMLFIISHAVREAGGIGKEVSKRLQFVLIDPQGKAYHAGYAPHLDLLAITPIELALIHDVLQAQWLQTPLDSLALHYAATDLVPAHYQEITERRSKQAEKIHQAVRERLVKEIGYQQDRYLKLKDDVAAGKQPRIAPEQFRRKAEELTERLKQRERELELMRCVVSSTPVIIGGALIIPQGLLAQRKGETQFAVDAAARARVEQIAMQAVIHAEQALGCTTKDVSAEKCGWDVTSRPPLNADGSLKPDRHIEVKGRAKGQSTITVTRNEIIYALNQADKFLLAIVLVDGDKHDEPFYIPNPFKSEPDFGVASVNYDLNELLSKAVSVEQTL